MSKRRVSEVMVVMCLRRSLRMQNDSASDGDACSMKRRWRRSSVSMPRRLMAVGKDTDDVDGGQ